MRQLHLAAFASALILTSAPAIPALAGPAGRPLVHPGAAYLAGRVGPGVGPSAAPPPALTGSLSSTRLQRAALSARGAARNANDARIRGDARIRRRAIRRAQLDGRTRTARSSGSSDRERFRSAVDRARGYDLPSPRIDARSIAALVLTAPIGAGVLYAVHAFGGAILSMLFGM